MGSRRLRISTYGVAAAVVVEGRAVATAKDVVPRPPCPADEQQKTRRIDR